MHSVIKGIDLFNDVFITATMVASYFFDAFNNSTKYLSSMLLTLSMPYDVSFSARCRNSGLGTWDNEDYADLDGWMSSSRLNCVKRQKCINPGLTVFYKK